MKDLCLLILFAVTVGAGYPAVKRLDVFLTANMHKNHDHSLQIDCEIRTDDDMPEQFQKITDLTAGKQLYNPKNRRMILQKSNNDRAYSA